MKKMCKEIIRLIKRYSHPAYRKVKGVGLPYFIWNFGERNSDKVIYFITDVSSKMSGVYSLYLKILSEMSFAYTMGWVPVIDDTPQLLRRTKIKIRKGRNVINEYFELNNPISVEEALQSRYVVMSDNCDKALMLKFAGKDKEIYKIWKESSVACQNFELDYWRDLASKNLLYKKETENELEQAYHEVIGDKDNVLGIAVREGKYYLTTEQRQKNGEYKQPAIEDVIALAHKYFRLWKCKYIYLSCETDQIIELFIREFSESEILYLKRKRRDLYDCCRPRKISVKYADSLENESNDYAYMKDMYILSKCELALLSVTGGTEAMWLKGAGKKNYVLME